MNKNALFYSKHYSLAFIFCLLSSFAWAQRTIDQQLDQLHHQLDSNYLQWIENAETHIIEAEWPKALAAYEQAFQLETETTAIHLSNALHVASRMEAYESAYKYAKQLVLLGCELDFFVYQTNLKPFTHSKPFLQLCKEYPGLRQTFIQQCNWALRSSIQSLFARDQYWRHRDPNYSVLRDSIFAEDDKIMASLIPMLEHQKVNEHSVGVFIRQDTIIDDSPLVVVLLHNYTNADHYKDGYNLTALLLNCIQTKNISADAFAFLNDSSSGFKIKKGFARNGVLWLEKDNLYQEKLNNEQLEQINDLRQKLHLCSVAEMRRKALYQYEHSSFQFFHTSYITTANFPEPILEAFFTKVE